MKYKSDTYNPTSIQRKNLKKLADYLEALPQDYAHFGMGSFAINEDDYTLDPYEIDKKSIHSCGTVACAIGHAPLLFRCGSLNWWEISLEKFGMDNDEAYEWDFCFSSSWSDVDNTAQGAGKRINWFIENGLPEDWDYNEDTVALYNPQEAI